MKTELLASFGVALALGSFASSPTIDSVSVSPSPERIYSNSEVTYELSGEPGIVTFHLVTNGVPVDCPYVHVTGDMNRLLQPGTHSFRWRNDIDWPGHAIRTNVCRIVVKAWSTNSPPDYMVYNLASPSEAPRYYAKAGDVPGGVTNRMYKIDHLVMRRIHAAGQTFVAGLSSTDFAYAAANAPHEVAFTKDYYIGIYEVTFGQMHAVMSSGTTYVTGYTNNTKNKGYDPAALLAEVGKTTDLHYSRAAGMTSYKWYWFGNGKVYPTSGRTCMADKYMQAFRTATKNDSMFLPTRWQWEFACRAGTGTRLYDGSSETNETVVGTYGWHSGNNADDPDFYTDQASGISLPHEVGLKTPNAWGLYDMLGNVAESCVDFWSGSAMPVDDVPYIDPIGGVPTSTTSWNQPICGGSFADPHLKLCSGYKLGALCNTEQSTKGFRLVCDVEVSR